jgi:hypothetical protein
MLVTYDREVDALAVDRLPGARRARTDVLEPGILLHRDKGGRPIELEIVAASTRYPVRDLEQIGSPVEWQTLGEASKEIGLSAATMRGLIRNKRLEAEKRGHDWRVSRAAPRC